MSQLVLVVDWHAETVSPTVQHWSRSSAQRSRIFRPGDVKVAPFLKRFGRQQENCRAIGSCVTRLNSVWVLQSNVLLQRPWTEVSAVWRLHWGFGSSVNFSESIAAGHILPSAGEWNNVSFIKDFLSLSVSTHTVALSFIAMEMNFVLSTLICALHLNRT